MFRLQPQLSYYEAFESTLLCHNFYHYAKFPKEYVMDIQFTKRHLPLTLRLGSQSIRRRVTIDFNYELGPRFSGD